jgi:hypothetical protein
VYRVINDDVGACRNVDTDPTSFVRPSNMSMRGEKAVGLVG